MGDDVKLPTEKEVRQLPRWARVAFAARCARRVEPLLKLHWPEAPQQDVQAVGMAIRAAEIAAARADAACAGSAEAVRVCFNAGILIRLPKPQPAGNP
jgi:hypothetical protein